MRAFLNLRHGVVERRRAFTQGLESLGYTVVHGLPLNPEKGDIFCTWNRIGAGNTWAEHFEKRGWPVLVTENATWGNGFSGKQWYHIARNRHNTSGMFPVGGHERWDDMGIPLSPFRQTGETVVLAQRGIGASPTRMPPQWPRKAAKRHGARVRQHPGTRPCKSLEDDLADCKTVVTWGSGAAIKALMWGCRVISDMPDWIGTQNNTEDDRLRMFRELAWAQWNLPEISRGIPFEWLLQP